VALADHQPSTILIELRGVVLDIDRDLGLQRHCQHLPSTVADDLIEQRPTHRGRSVCVGLGLFFYYLEHVPSENQRANAGPDQNLQTSRSSSGRCATFTSRRRGPSTGSDHCSAIISVAHVLLTSCPAVVVVARMRSDLPVAHVLLTSCPAVVVVARMRSDLPVAHVLLTSCPAVLSCLLGYRSHLPVPHGGHRQSLTVGRNTRSEKSMFTRMILPQTDRVKRSRIPRSACV